MGAIAKGIISLDPRTKILLLISTSIFIFANNNYVVETSVLILLCIIAICLGTKKTALKGITVYVFLSVFKYWILPSLPNIIAANFNIFVVTVIKLLPCFIAGQVLVKTTSIRTLMYALQKLRLPQTLVIPLTISIRYFPALLEEWRAISDAMKMRKVKGISKIEFAYVPLMITASSTADELSQAITARGIDNPAPKTCAIELRFQFFDVVIMLLSVGMLGVTIAKIFI